MSLWCHHVQSFSQSYTVQSTLAPVWYHHVQSFSQSCTVQSTRAPVWCHHVQSFSQSCTVQSTRVTYQTLRFYGSQEVHVHSDPHVERTRLVARQLPSVVAAGGDQSVEQLWTEAGVAEVWTGPAQKHV
jgi:hypothetical protein